MTGERPTPRFERAFVTGATGYIGGRLMRRLSESGVGASVMVRASSPPDRLSALPDGIDVFRDDGDTANLTSHLSSAEPQIVFHLAARYVAADREQDISELVADNVGLTARVCEAAMTAGCTGLIAAGTAWQNAGSPAGDPTPSPNTIYAATKQAADDIISYFAHACGLGATTLKIYDSYGPDDPRPKFLNALRAHAANGTAMAASSGDQRLHLVHVDDLVDAFVHAANRRLAGDEASPHASYTLPSTELMDLRALADAWQTANRQSVQIDWGTIPQRPGAIMEPWEGPALPGWSPHITIEDGLASL
jgi:nucleoside-diphosphate-sugar epimerase